MVATEDQVFGVGANDDGGLGTGDRRDRLNLAPLKKLNGQQVVSMSAGEAHAAAVTADGRLYAWGRLSPARTGRVAAPQLVSALDQAPVRAVACGADFSLVVLRDGRLLSWGRGSLGQLGLGKVTKVDVPQVVAERDEEGRPFTAAAAGWAHGMALTDAGALYTFGFNAKGQLGLGDTQTRFFPERVTRFCVADGIPEDTQHPAQYTVENGPVRVARMSAGRHHSAAIDTSGTVLVWGSNRGNRAIPAPEPATAVAAGAARPQAGVEESKEPAQPRGRDLVRGNLRSSPGPGPISPFERYHMASQAAVAGRGCPKEASAAVAGVSRTQTLPRDSAALILLPKQVSHPLLGDLKAAEIACGETSTACFTPAALEGVDPACAIVDSGRLLRLTGRGIRSVASMAPSVPGADREVVGASAGVPGLLGDGHGPDTLELTEGSSAVLGVSGGVLVAVPGCVARFTRPARPHLLEAATARRRRARELAATLGVGDPLGDEHDEEPDEEDDIDSVAEEDAAVMVRYAPVYAAPSSSGHGDAIFAPIAPFPSACDLVVQVLLRAAGVPADDEDAWETVSGSLGVIACSPPVVESVQPPSLPLVPGPTVKLSGPGLWSWMKADPAARQRAVELEQAAEEQVMERERLEAKVMELELLVRRWNEAEVAGEDLEGMPPPAERAQVRRDAAAAAAELAGLPPLRLRVSTKPEGGDGGRVDGNVRALDSPVEEEAPTADSDGGSGGGALLRFLVETSMGGEVIAQSDPVAGWFTAEFLEKELLEGGGGRAGLSGGDDDSMGGVEAGEGDDGLEKLMEAPGKYIASLSAPLPRMSLQPGTSGAELTLVVELSLDGGATWSGTGPAGQIVAFECQPAGVGPPVLSLDGSIQSHVLEVCGSGLAPLPSARLRLLLHPFGPDGDGVVPIGGPDVDWDPLVLPVEPPMDGDDVEELSRLLAAVDTEALREHPAVQAAMEVAAGDAVVVAWEAELSMDGQTFEPIPFPEGDGQLRMGAGTFHGLFFLAHADDAETIPVDAALGGEVPVLIRGPAPAPAAVPEAAEAAGSGDEQAAAAAPTEGQEEEAGGGVEVEAGEGAGAVDGLASSSLATFLVEQSAALGSLRVRAAVGQEDLPVTATVSSGGLIVQLPALRSAAAAAPGAAGGADEAEAEAEAAAEEPAAAAGQEPEDEGVVRVDGSAPWHVEVMVSVDGGSSTLGPAGGGGFGCTSRFVAYDKSGLTLGAVGPKKLKPANPLTVEVVGCERLGCSRAALDGMEWLVAIGREAEALEAAAAAGEAEPAEDPRQGCRLPAHITAPAASEPIDEATPVTLEVQLPAAGEPGPEGGAGLPVNATTVSVSMDGGATWLAGTVSVKLAKK